MIRTTAFVLCLAGFAWLGAGHLQFRQLIRTGLRDAHVHMEQIAPGSAGGAGKVLNSYYESVYDHLPPVVLPASMLMLGATILLLARKRKAA